MFRKDLLELLRRAPRSVTDIATLLELEPKAVEDDRRHLLKSVKHTGYRVTITPARCRHGGFIFHADKRHKPGKCPRCRHTWISPPLIQMEARAAMSAAALTIRVECDAGHRGEPEPRRFWLGERPVSVEEVLDRWLAPEHRYFKVRGDGGRYLLRHDPRADRWELTFYERAG